MVEVCQMVEVAEAKFSAQPLPKRVHVRNSQSCAILGLTVCLSLQVDQYELSFECAA